jgi:hypothetical protein
MNPDMIWIVLLHTTGVFIEPTRNTIDMVWGHWKLRSRKIEMALKPEAAKGQAP